MTKENTARKAVIGKNPDTVKFQCAPFYNLANIRKNTLQIIVRSSTDTKKVKAIRETLVSLIEYLDVRATHGADVRAKRIEAASAERAKAVHVAAQVKLADAKADVHRGTAMVKAGKKVLAALTTRVVPAKG